MLLNLVRPKYREPTLLLILFALRSGDVKSVQPLLTIPVGGR